MPGLHVEIWHDWGVWFRLGVPGVVMFGLEWWICEAGSLTAGMHMTSARLLKVARPLFTQPLLIIESRT